MKRAACHEYPTPEDFFPISDHGWGLTAANMAAKAFCQSCPIKAECLRGALERREQFGIWGGKVFTSRYARKRSREAVRV